MATQAVPPPEYEHDDGCAICGSSQSWEDCWNCGGDGSHELYDEDPLWYDPDDIETCQVCEGNGGWWLCLNAENHALGAKP